MKKSEIFDSLECYYPITFNKPEKSLIDIGKDDLEEALNRCLYNEGLEDKTWALILEKIESGVLESQMAGLNTLNYGFWVIFIRFYNI